MDKPGKLAWRRGDSMRWLRSTWMVCVVGALGMFGTTASAADATLRSEYAKTIKASESISVLRDDLFGDQTSLYTGSTEFTAVDVSLPGTGLVPVTLGRHHPVEIRPGMFGGPIEQDQVFIEPVHVFGDWQLDVPHLSGVFRRSEDNPESSWQVGNSNPFQRCTVANASIARPAFWLDEETRQTWFAPSEYWHGNSLHVPGAGDQEMLVVTSANPQHPTDGKSYYWTTSDGWYFSCLPGMAPGNNRPGEGFLAVDPNGTRYWFDWMVAWDYPRITKVHRTPPLEPLPAAHSQSSQPAATGSKSTMRADVAFVLRSMVTIYPTRIEDRFGNAVVYDWDEAQPTRLKSITADDGRVISLAYTPSGQIDTVTAGTRVWEYTYLANHLTEVRRPDGSTWKYSLFALDSLYVNDIATYEASCWGPILADNQVSRSGTITHPSGAVGSFTFRPTEHGRSYVDDSGLNCVKSPVMTPDSNDFVWIAIHPSFFSSLSLVKKTITGPGLPSSGYVWQYAYGSPNNSRASQCTGGCVATKTVTVTGPSDWTRYTFSNRYQRGEGKLLKTEIGSDAAHILRTVTQDYQLEPAGQAYPARLGESPFRRSDRSAEILTPLKQRKTTQQGRTFTWQATAFDAYANPATVTRASSLGFSKRESYTYVHNLNLWVLSQPGTTKDLDSGRIERQTFYNGKVQPWVTQTFGINGDFTWYNADGSVQSVQKPTGQSTRFANYKRGIPQSITLPGGASYSAVVNGNGWIDSVTDPLGSKTCYQYDLMGRMKTITYPSETQAGVCNTSMWLSSSRTFQPINSSEYGLAAGHWRQTVSTGNARHYTYYDAFWRPVLSREEDVANTAATRRFNVTHYDHAGRTTYQSRPITSVSNYASNYGGVSTQYDALGRPDRVTQSSEIGNLVTDYQYNSGFQTRVINPRGKVTTTTYYAWDEPTTQYPRAIYQPEAVTTSIARDDWGKPLYVSRSGVTRRYVYDTAQRLCKRYDPESNWSVINYDGYNRINWTASGVTNTTSTSACQQSSVLSSLRVARGYDTSDRVTTIDPPSGTDNTWYSYYPGGQLKTAVTGPSASHAASRAWTYSYFRRGLPKTDSLRVDNKTFNLTYGYNTGGALASIRYPDNSTQALSPNALGQPTRIGSYATLATYHPGGQLKGFRYGNGITFSQILNARGLPDTRRDLYGSTKYLDYGYDYDANGNLVGLSDGLGIDQRNMSYDDLDRLTGVDGPDAAPTYEGNSSYDYDARDNIKQWVLRPAGLPSATYDYHYDGFNRLLQVTANGSPLADYQYDPRGNMTLRGVDGQQTTQQFDALNRLTRIDGAPRNKSLDGTTFTETYAYDANGHRTVSTNKAGKKRYAVWTRGGQRLYSEDGWDGKKHRFMYLGDRLVAETKTPISGGSTETLYHHTDALGSATSITRSNRTKVNQGNAGIDTIRSAYGRIVLGQEANGPGYAGHLGDRASDLTYMKARYYDNVAMRFISTDPVDVDAATGANFNRYWYANNNPYRFVDPDGRYICQGTTNECKEVKKAVDSIRRASRKSSTDFRERQRLNRIVKHLGNEGDGNIIISTSSLQNSGGNADGNTITIDYSEISVLVQSYNSSNSQISSGSIFVYLVARAIAHEASHQLNGGTPANKNQSLLSEFYAYEDQSFVDHGTGLQSDIWWRGISPQDSQNAISRAAAKSTATWCANWIRMDQAAASAGGCP